MVTARYSGAFAEAVAGTIEYRTEAAMKRESSDTDRPDLDLYQASLRQARDAAAKSASFDTIATHLKTATTRARSCVELIACAALWKELAGNDDRARRCLLHSEYTARSKDDVVTAIRAWCDICGEEEALSCAARMQASDHHLAVLGSATALKEVLGAVPMARASLMRAEARMGFGLVLVYIVREWQELFGDREAAECIRRIQDRAKQASTWLACARAWQQLPGRAAEARSCLAQVRATTDDPLPIFACIKVWKDVLGGTAAKRRLKRIQKEAGDTTAWLECARAWWHIFSDKAKAVACLRRAARGASLTDLLQCAKAYVTYRNDTSSAKDRITKAEKLVSSCDGWLSCAQAWAKCAGDLARARQCMGYATKCAITEDERVHCARMWHDLLADDGKARECVRGMDLISGDVCSNLNVFGSLLSREEGEYLLSTYERNARDARSLVECADTWQYVFDDREHAIRSVKSATAVAGTTSELVACARAQCLRVGDQDEAERLLCKASLKATEVSELVACAECWLDVMYDLRQAGECLWRAVEKQPRGDEMNHIVHLLWHVQPRDARVAEVLRRQGDVSRDGWELHECAATWSRECGDDVAASTCLKKASGLYPSVEWLTECARTAAGLRQGDLAEEFMAAAKRHARKSATTAALLEVSKGWRLLDKLTRARELLWEARCRAKTAGDHLACAITVTATKGSRKDVKQCIWNAGRCAERPYELALCAQAAFRLLDDAKLAGYYLRSAQMLRGAAYESAYCAMVWKRINDEKGKRQRCTKKALESSQCKQR